MEIVAEKREIFGKKTKQLRNQNKMPAIVYGSKMEPLPITLNILDFVKVYSKAGETTLVDLIVGDMNEKVLIKDVQVHPVSDNPIHADFLKVDLTQKIEAPIPVRVINEELSPVVKSGEGMALQLMNEIPVEALPSDLPSEFIIDVSHLQEIGDAITIAELDYDREKVAVLDYEEDDLVVKIDYAEMEEEPEEEVSEEDLIADIEATEEAEDEEEDGAADSRENTSEE